MIARERAFAAIGIGIAFVALLGGLAWVAFSLMPIRAAQAGPFAPNSLTPSDALLQQAPGANWPMFGASPARARYVPSGLRPPFRLVYRIAGGSLIEMPPAVSQGRVVFGTHAGSIIAAGVADGTRLWRTRIGRCIASSPAVRGGIVYLGWSGPAPCRGGKDSRGGVVALSLRTGRVLWRFNAGNVESSPAVVDDMLFFSGFRSSDESYVYAMRLGRRHRRLVWSYPIASKVASSPAIVGRTLFVSAYNRRLYSFDTRSGRLKWTTTAFSEGTETRVLLGVRSLIRHGSWSGGGYYATPAVAYNRVYLGVIDGVFSAFDSRTGAHRWSRRLDGSIYGSAAVWHERVYVGTTDGAFYALSARDGRLVWKQDLGGKILGSPTVTNGRVYIATTNRETFVLDARTGKVQWRFADGDYSPLVVAGKRALLVGKGRIYGLENAPRIPNRLVGLVR